MDVKEVLAQMTLEEKARILTGAESLVTAGVERLGVPAKNLADGPNGCLLYTSCSAAFWREPLSVVFGWLSDDV